MRRKALFAVGISAALFALATGCEWKGGGSDDSWSSKYEWANFSGVYRARDGGVLVRNPGYSPGQGSSTGSVVRTRRSERIGTGDAVARSFGAALSRTPIAVGSVSVTDGFETFTDSGAAGSLVGDKGGTGTVNYQTGAISVTFNLEPGVGAAVVATYEYEEIIGGGSPTGSPQGSSMVVYSLTVHQQGNQISITDNNGGTYNGRLGSLSSSGGFANDQVADGSTVVAQFSAHGVSANGRLVTITGTLQGVYQQTTAGDTGGGGGQGLVTWLVENRAMDATWIEENPYFAGDIQAVTSSTTINVTL